MYDYGIWRLSLYVIFLSLFTALPMPVLHRWDENDDVVAKPIWRRYDETESGNDSESGPSEAEPPSRMR